MNILEKTGITFETGKTLTARELNILNNTIEEVILIMGPSDFNMLAIVQDGSANTNANFAIIGLIIIVFALIAFTLLKNNKSNK